MNPIIVRQTLLVLLAAMANTACMGLGSQPVRPGPKWVLQGTNVFPLRDQRYEQGRVSGPWTGDMLHHDGLWVMGDGQGGLWYSSDAISWTRASITQWGQPRSMQNASLRSINRSPNGTWIATFLGGGAPLPAASGEPPVPVYQRAPIARSLDGMNWDVRHLPRSCGVHFSATDGAGTWIAQGCGNNLLVSRDDGLTWSEEPTGLPEPLNAHGYHNGTWIVGAGWGPQGGIFHSQDLFNWTKALAFPPGVVPKRMLLLNGQLLMTGSHRFIASSDDCVNWVQRHFDPPGRPGSLMQCGIWHPRVGYILGGEHSALMYSPDLLTWAYGQENLGRGEIVGMSVSPAGTAYFSGPNGGVLHRLETGP